MVTKICIWDGGVCPNVSCSFIDFMGNVCLCFRHKNPAGFHLLRIQGLPVVPVFNKHRRS